MKKLNWLGLILTLVMCLAIVPAQAETKTMTVESGHITVDSPYTNDELFALYVQGEMDEAVYGDAGWYGTQGRDRLKTDAQKALYDQLKAFFGMVAKGSSRSTVYTVDLSGLGIVYEFTNASLGVDAIFADGTWNILPEAQEKIDEATIKLFTDLGLPNLPMGLTEAPLMEALLHDCPSELYWFDKTYGYSIPYVIVVSKNGSAHTYKITEFQIQFPVSEDYLSGQVTDYTILTSKVTAVKTALENAQAIVEKHKNKSDEEKLRAYMEEICALVSYNDSAADKSTNTPYGNPWQLIWVFDGDESTKVVCEGYAKAFQYLCDLSGFNGDVYCYSVSGIMKGGTGAGRHMWNIVQTPNGNYLVDVTNCDTGTIGSPDKLFMVSQATGAWNTSYQVAVPGQSTITYTYDDDVESLWGEEVLKLGETVHVHSWKPVYYEWTDNKGQCTATRMCDCGARETVAAEISEHVTKVATCVEKGITTYTATFSEDWAEAQSVPVETNTAATTHVEGTVVLRQKDATCTAAGYTGDICCAGCEMVHTYGNTIPALEHDFAVELEHTRVEGNCKDEGSVTMECSRCDATKVQTLGKVPANHVGETYVEDAVAATCKNPGYTGDTYCADCNTLIECGEAISATGEHSFTIEVEDTKTPATCKDTGSVTKKCDVCDETEVQTLPINPDNHPGETYLADDKAATCGSEGYTGDKLCMNCDALVEKGTVIPATDAHNFTIEVENSRVDATCTTEGHVTKKCEGCEATQTQTLEVDPDHHAGPMEVRDAEQGNCVTDGYTGDQYCLGCTKLAEKGTVIFAIGEHDFSLEVAGTKIPATCKDEGSVTMKCSRCDASEEQTLSVDKSNHIGETYLADDKAATCGSAGYTGDTCCAGCDDLLEYGEAIPATGEHDYSIEVAGTRVWSTCITEGSVTMKCSGCDATEDQPQPLAPHNHIGDTYISDAADPTCGNEGYTGSIMCSDCHMVVRHGESIPATGEHNFSIEVEDTRIASTCKTAGSVTMQCSGCIATKEETLALDPEKHEDGTEVRDVVAPDCANDGYTGDTYCLGCENKIADGEVDPATGEHNFTEEVAGTRVAATCMAEGSVTMKCTGCSNTETQTIEKDAANHTRQNTTVKDAVAATCGAEGYTGDTYCECGEKIADGEAIPATGEHNFVNEVAGTRVDATCKETGSVTMQCSGCEETEEQPLPLAPNNHTGETYVEGYKAATCGSAGSTGDIMCSGCNALLEDNRIIPATGEHNFTEEVEGTKTPSTCKIPGKVTMQCSGCEETEEKPLPLDTENHEGETEVRDAKTATCGETGYTGDTYCLGCNSKKDDGEIIPATEEHSFTEEVGRVASTCKTAGIVTMKCANCTATNEETLELDPEKHEGDTEVRGVVAPDCANDGYTGNTYCLGCNAKLADGEVDPATGSHNYVTPVESTRVPSTCKTAGSVAMQCSGCTATQTQPQPLDPANHEGETEIRNAKAATCGEEGYTGDTYCIACNTKLADGTAIPATGAHIDEDNDDICDGCEKALKHDVEVECGAEGSANASAEKAEPGDQVIITVNVGEGYEPDTVTVRDAQGNAIACERREDGSYVFIQPESAVKVIVTFRAVQPDLYKLTVVNGTGSGEYEEGVSVAIKADEKTGMTFIGWQSSAELTFAVGNAQTAEATVVMPAADVTITAVYEAVELPKAVLSFNANGGSGVMLPKDVTAGEYISLPACQFIAPRGKTFEGWALTPDGAILNGTVLVEGDTQLYAIWKDAQTPVPPVTGDDAHLGLWLTLLLLSGTGAALMLGKKRKA